MFDFLFLVSLFSFVLIYFYREICFIKIIFSTYLLLHEMSWWLFLSPSLDHSSDGCRIIRYPISCVMEPCEI